MKKIKVKFNNIWDDNSDCEEYEVIIFSVPENLNIDIQEETLILDSCYTILNDYDCDDEEELSEVLEYFDNITHNDIGIAKRVLDDGNSGLIASRIADFIAEKYPNVDWETLDFDCDLEIDIE